jgi:hypothetical protein
MNIHLKKQGPSLLGHSACLMGALLLTASGLSTSALAAISVNPTQAQIACAGSLGTLDISYNSGKSTVKLHQGDLNIERTFSPESDTAEVKSVASAYESLEQPAKWLSVGNFQTVRVWVPEHPETFCTRLDCGHKKVVPGHYEFNLKNFIDVMFDISADQVYSLNRIEISLGEIKTLLKDLGENTHCTATHLFL